MDGPGIRCSARVELAFGLDDAESQIIMNSLPPRDPLARLTMRLQSLEAIEQ